MQRGHGRDETPSPRPVREYPEASLREIRYALDDLSLDGVGLLSQYNGKYLGDERFDAVMAELNSRKAVVYVHPSDPADAYDPKLGISNALVEAAFEATRTVANRMYNGTTDRYPDIRFILAHGGGAIPFLAWRMALIQYAQKGKKTPILRTLYDLMVKSALETGLNIIRKMYVDTGLTSGSATLKALKEFPGPSRILFGSDFPFAKVAPIVAKNLSKDGDFTDAELEAVFRGNCQKLFP
ncbi:MAG: amidohydrolase [Chloroflexales bacterium]|nr:amidohydrolase [Chloroflexales bacterium]